MFSSIGSFIVAIMMINDVDWYVRDAGKVSVKMLMVYVNAMGGKLRFSILMSWFLLVELCRVAATVWLSYWTGVSDKPGTRHAASFLFFKHVLDFLNFSNSIFSNFLE